LTCNLHTCPAGEPTEPPVTTDLLEETTDPGEATTDPGEETTDPAEESSSPEEDTAALGDEAGTPRPVTPMPPRSPA
jgi:hypothetical protein